MPESDKEYELRLDIERVNTETDDCDRPDTQPYILAEGSYEKVEGVYAEVQSKFAEGDWQTGLIECTVFITLADESDADNEEWSLGCYTRLADAQKLVSQIKKFVEKLENDPAGE